ncbi:MAG: hypothetical protein SOZ56_04865 [Oscillospiraceae bacterium]|nr:hypothetical protein [Oscillospiraceae bacterium]
MRNKGGELLCRSYSREKKLYISLNVVMLIVTVAPLLFYPTAWVGFLISCLYAAFAVRFLWIAAIITNIAAFFLAAANNTKAIAASVLFGFIGGLAGSFVSGCDSELSKSLRCIFIMMLWGAVIAPAANILLHQYDILPMLM